MEPRAPSRMDLEALRTIAHPLRLRLYELLFNGGPSTASRLCAAVGIAVGSASYHLQRLARAGLIEEAPTGSSDLRERWWRVVPGGLRWSPAEFAGNVDARNASTAVQRSVAQRRFEKLDEWLSTWHSWDQAWIEAAADIDATFVLDPDKTAALLRDLREVMSRYQLHDPGDQRSDAQRKVAMFLYLFPLPDGERYADGQ